MPSEKSLQNEKKYRYIWETDRNSFLPISKINRVDRSGLTENAINIWHSDQAFLTLTYNTSEEAQDKLYELVDMMESYWGAE